MAQTCAEVKEWTLEYLFPIHSWPATHILGCHPVLGPVESSDLGFTLSHDHVGTNAAGLRHTYPEFIDRSGISEQLAAALKAAYN